MNLRQLVRGKKSQSADTPHHPPSSAPAANLHYDFEQDVAPFVGLLALESSLGNKPLAQGQGDKLVAMWRDALREWYAGDRAAAFPKLKGLLSELSACGLSETTVGGLANHQYGIQLRILGDIEAAAPFLDRAVTIYVDWLDRHEGYGATNIVISGFRTYLLAIADGALGQVGHEAHCAGNHLDALDYAEKGIELAQLRGSVVGALVHTVTAALAHSGLHEPKSAKELYDRALQLSRVDPGGSQHDKERYAFACWQLGKLAGTLGETRDKEQLFSAAAGACPVWIVPDMAPYREAFQAEIGRKSPR